MICRKCKKESDIETPFCPFCGTKQAVPTHNTKARGNSTGSIFKMPNGKWRAIKTLSIEYDDKKKQHRKTKQKSGFATKKDASAWLHELSSGKKRVKDIKFKKLYDLWRPSWADLHTRDTMNCYSAAMNYFKPIWYDNIRDVDIDDLQDCVDECPQGKRTRQNMKAVAGLLYKYGIPRGYITDNLNLATYLVVGGGEQNHKSGFTDAELEKIRNAVGKTQYADYVYALCYLGFRPSEFLALDALKYDRTEKAFVGGAKTEAGTDRTVTVSPKIQSIIDRLVKNKISGPVFCNSDGTAMDLKDFRERFYAVLDALEINNPVTVVDGKEIHKLTPHSCRHTFATLLKRSKGSDKDKLALIGHTSTEMLRYYQDVHYDDLRQITNAL